MAVHLDRWATERLDGPAAWEETLVISRAWLDYSARNQLLLASYGLDGPVAGAETWRLVPSTFEGRGCGVRAGEHGWPVRVPVTTGGNQPDPFLGGHRPTQAAVERWEWRPVFEISQLARRPAPDALVPVELPRHLDGPAGDAEFLAAVRSVAGATVRGRLPRSREPSRVLAEAAGRLPLSSKRPPLDETLAQQVGWLVTDRVGRATSDGPPRFDPSGLTPRERWERLQDVLEPARKLTAALGVAIGVDLVASPLPRMEIIDDRVVPAGRRHRLPAASLAQLPVGRWVTVGPYTAAEWAARGEHAAGSGAFLRLNKSAYLCAMETGDGAAWRLEDVAARTGHGLLATGTSPSLADARADGVTMVRSRYPALFTAPADTTPSPPGTAGGWEPMPRPGRANAAEMCHLTDHITLYALPGPGGRWQPALHTPATVGLELLPLQPTIVEARDAAQAAGRRLARVAAVADPARADQTVAALADNGPYSRRELAALVTPRLADTDAARVEAAQPAELVELLGAAGFSPATTVAVLAADRTDPVTTASLLPMAGVPIPDAIRVLHDRWELPFTSAAELLDATATDMRQAGCTPVEIMAVRPRDVLRTLPADPRLWELAAGSMATAGHPTTLIVGHLVAHAPTPDAFTAGLLTIADDDPVGLAARCRAHPDQLAAASEASGLSPADTAATLAGVTPDAITLDTVALRCEGNRNITTSIATRAGISATAIDHWLHPGPTPTPTSIRVSVDPDAAALLDRLPPAGPAVTRDPVDALDILTAGLRTPHLEPSP